MAEDAEYSAFVVEMIVGVSELRIHCLSARSRNGPKCRGRCFNGLFDYGTSIDSMRKMPSPLTLPICNAAMPCARAVESTVANDDVETETTARAPRSPKNANSAGPRWPRSSSVICAPRELRSYFRVGPKQTRFGKRHGQAAITDVMRRLNCAERRQGPPDTLAAASPRQDRWPVAGQPQFRR